MFDKDNQGRVESIKEGYTNEGSEELTCRISRLLPRNCILAFLREPKRITLVHLYHTWFLRCVFMHKLLILCQTMSMFSYN